MILSDNSISLLFVSSFPAMFVTKHCIGCCVTHNVSKLCGKSNNRELDLNSSLFLNCCYNLCQQFDPYMCGQFYTSTNVLKLHVTIWHIATQSVKVDMSSTYHITESVSFVISICCYPGIHKAISLVRPLEIKMRW